MPYKQPPKDKQFKKGQSGNPAGRPKGIPNRSTIAKEILEMKGKPPEEILRYFQQYYPNYFQKKNERWTSEFLGYLRMMSNAILKGDVKSFELILDSAYGTPKQNIGIDTEDTITEIEIKLKKDETDIGRGQEHNEDIPEEPEGISGKEA